MLTFDTARAETEETSPTSSAGPTSRTGIGCVRDGGAGPLRPGPPSRALGAGPGRPPACPSEAGGRTRPRWSASPPCFRLLGALAVVVDGGEYSTTRTTTDYVGADRVEALLTSALGGLDATDVRSLTRDGAVPRDRATPARELVRRAVLAPTGRRWRASTASRPSRHPAGRAARRTPVRRAWPAAWTVEEVLWVLWDGSDWGRRLRQATQAGGQGARLAHRDLDAICALFESAARAEEQKGHTSVRSFVATLRSQEIPADTLADRGVRGDAVRLLHAVRPPRSATPAPSSGAR